MSHLLIFLISYSHYQPEPLTHSYYFRGGFCSNLLFEASTRPVVTGTMHDWASTLIATAFFALLSPGLLIQMPGRHRPVEFMLMKTSAVSILAHAVVYGLLLIFFFVVLDVHVYV
uniref:Uncharacterized protein n=1 Tax=Kalanchoe fedtschenkoi TaxID=63787 RepID=A0A7N0UNC3_KALFE